MYQNFKKIQIFKFYVFYKLMQSFVTGFFFYVVDIFIKIRIYKQ